MEHLEAEVKGLLAQLEELAWNLPPGPWVPAPDLLGDGERLAQRRGQLGLGMAAHHRTGVAWTSRERRRLLQGPSGEASPSSPREFCAPPPPGGAAARHLVRASGRAGAVPVGLA